MDQFLQVLQTIPNGALVPIAIIFFLLLQKVRELQAEHKVDKAELLEAFQTVADGNGKRIAAMHEDVRILREQHDHPEETGFGIAPLTPLIRELAESVRQGNERSAELSRQSRALTGAMNEVSRYLRWMGQQQGWAEPPPPPPHEIGS